ncbi:MAG: hypothetical protein GWP07_08045 [Xanthomonadaceae bacterium]|nr:hypothetical protein [Xanthomonadaceae bacterium]
MTVKEHVTQEVKKIAAAGKSVDEKVVAFVKEDFHKTLADCEKTGHSVRLNKQPKIRWKVCRTVLRPLGIRPAIS